MSRTSVADSSNADSKRQLRQNARVARAALEPAQRERASSVACERLERWLETRPERQIAVYLARGDELSLDLLIERLLAKNYLLCAPRFEDFAPGRGFSRLEDLHSVKIGVWNVREPQGETMRPQLALVPGLAFDRIGNRLGTGGGWYDRVLSAVPLRVGVCFEAQLVAELPCEPHDIKMDFVATEREIQPASPI